MKMAVKEPASLSIVVATVAAAAVLLLRRRRTLRARSGGGGGGGGGGSSSSSSDIVVANEALQRVEDECTSSSPLVIVIGLGGVGSHAAHLLLRGGCNRLRLVDFDQVTLSSLNRHAVAARSDVGTPKAVALRTALLRIDPTADIEACVELFDDASATRLLAGKPALIIDAIDDLATKACLLYTSPSPRDS